MNKYKVTQWAELRIRIMRTEEVEAENNDEAYEMVTDQIYDEIRAALEPTGAYIDDVNWYNSEIKETN